MFNRTEEQKAYKKAYNKAYQLSHKDERKAYDKARNFARKDEKKAYDKANHKERPWLSKEYQAKYKAKKLGCEIYPKEHKRIMVGFYKLSEAMTLETGIQWSVDHFVPLSKGGGHTIFNVQLMPLSENKKKWAKLI